MKAITGLRSQTYEERLVELKLPSLRERQHEMDMVQTYKLLNSESGEQIFKRADIRRGTRATAGRDNLLKKRSFHEFRSNFFSSQTRLRKLVQQKTLKAYTGVTVWAL